MFDSYQYDNIKNYRLITKVMQFYNNAKKPNPVKMFVERRTKKLQ